MSRRILDDAILDILILTTNEILFTGHRFLHWPDPENWTWQK